MQWFREQAGRFDKGYLVVLAICLLAVWPFVSRPDLPQATDAELHIFRLAELSYLVRAGELYPRWAPHFYYGYGYPIFNFYAPLTYYLGLVVELMPRLNAVDGVKAVFVLGLLSAGVGLYGFVRDNWGRTAGYVAAALYVYAPYVQYVDPHARGDLAESFSFGVFALALWALDRLRRGATAGRWLAAVGLVAAVILSHNLMAMVCFGLVAGWAIFQLSIVNGQWSMVNGWRARQPGEGGRVNGEGNARLPRPYLMVLAALGVGVGLAAFFWLPVALEQESVNLSNVIGSGSHFDFRNHFLSWGELLRPSLRPDWGASEPAFVLNMGVAQWVLGGMGLVLVAAGRVRQRRHLLFFALAAVLLTFMMLPASTWLWERLPLLPYLQFPWRLLGPLAAMVAVLGGVAVKEIGDWRLEITNPISNLQSLISRWLPALVIAVILLLALPLSQVPPWPADFGEVSSRRVFDIELQGRWLGTTSTADFLPATVDVAPVPVTSLSEDVVNGRLPERVNRPALPRHAHVTSELLSPLHMRYRVTAEQDFLLRLFLFDFPGWTATVDGAVAETELGRPEGFLVVPVPAGAHVVEVEFRSTPARRLGEGVAIVSLLLTLAAAVLVRSNRFSGQTAEAITTNQGEVSWRVVAVVGVVMVGHLLMVEPMGLVRYESAGWVAIPAGTDALVDFQEQVALIGYDAPVTAGPGETIEVTLYWKAQQPLPINYQVFAHVLRPDGTILVQSDKLNPGEFPTERWPLDKYVRDEHELMIPADTPPGEYRLSVGLWVAAEGWRLPVVDAAGVQIGDNYALVERLEIRD